MGLIVNQKVALTYQSTNYSEDIEEVSLLADTTISGVAKQCSRAALFLSASGSGAYSKQNLKLVVQ
jgi:hypothetical protein